MESQKQSCGRALHAFMSSLLNYRANTSTVDVRMIKSQHEQWKQAMAEKEQIEEYLRQQYLEKHDAPRASAKQKYEEFLEAKNQKFYQWMRTKNHGDLFEWLEFENKEDMTPLMNQVYTQYTQ